MMQERTTHTVVITYLNQYEASHPGLRLYFSSELRVRRQRRLLVAPELCWFQSRPRSCTPSEG